MGATRHRLGAVGASLGLALTACGSGAGDAPAGAGLCWRSTAHAGKARFGVLSRGDANLETCAMHLEVLRRMHGWPAVSGAYEGQYLYVDPARMVAASSLKTPGYSVLTSAQRKDLEEQITALLQAQQPAAAQPPKAR